MTLYIFDWCGERHIFYFDLNKAKNLKYPLIDFIVVKCMLTDKTYHLGKDFMESVLSSGTKLD
jgi:hypothetical protein